MKSAELLYIEDNFNDIELTLRVLDKKNLTDNILVLDDGEEALEYIFCEGKYVAREKHQNPKLILLDLKLPKVSGLEILKKIKSNKETKSIPVVMLTSSEEESDILESYDYGANAYITKPVNFDNFSETISTLGHFWLKLNNSL